MWAPKPDLVRLDVEGVGASDEALGRRLVARAPSTAPPRRPLRIPARRRPHRAARPTIGPPARRGARTLAIMGCRSATRRLDRRRVDRAFGRRRGDLRAARRHLHRRRHVRLRRSKSWTIWSISAIDFVELMPVNSFSGTHGWGYDGVLWYSVHEPYGGPDGTGPVRRRLPRPRLGRVDRRGVQPLRPVRQLPAAVRPVPVLGEQPVG